jgi:hypothetical protein
MSDTHYISETPTQTCGCSHCIHHTGGKHESGNRTFYDGICCHCGLEYLLRAKPLEHGPYAPHTSDDDTMSDSTAEIAVGDTISFWMNYRAFGKVGGWRKYPFEGRVVAVSHKIVTVQRRAFTTHNGDVVPNGYETQMQYVPRERCKRMTT